MLSIVMATGHQRVYCRQILVRINANPSKVSTATVRKQFAGNVVAKGILFFQPLELFCSSKNYITRYTQAAGLGERFTNQYVARLKAGYWWAMGKLL